MEELNGRRKTLIYRPIVNERENSVFQASSHRRYLLRFLALPPLPGHFSLKQAPGLRGPMDSLNGLIQKQSLVDLRQISLSEPS